jgi:ABC-type lipoprotein release transport system permease subunit
MISTSTLRIAWRNLGRSKRRTLLALAAIAVGQLAFLAVAALMNGYGKQYFKALTGPFVGHAQVHAPQWRDDRSIDLTLMELESTLGVIREDPQVDRASPRVYSPVLAALEEDGFMGVVIGIDLEAESHSGGILADETYAWQLGDRRVLVGINFAQKNNIAPGSEIALVGQDVDGSIANDLYTVSAIIPSTVDVVNNLGIVMSLQDAQELLLMPDQAHEIVVYVKNMDLLDETVGRLSSTSILRGTEVLPYQELVPQFLAMLEMIDIWALFILFIVFIAALAGIANTMLMSTFERKHEFGMLLSLGCGPGRLSRIVAVEAVLIGLTGVAIGTALGLGFVLLTSGSGIDYAALGGNESSYEIAFRGLQLSSHVFPELHLKDILIGVTAVLLTSFIAVIWPMVHLARLEPMEAMRP